MKRFLMIFCYTDRQEPSIIIIRERVHPAIDGNGSIEPQPNLSRNLINSVEDREIKYTTRKSTESTSLYP